ncbi:MFS transporter [Burkholderia contaminans]|nr:MFS transporter [Burkholderia contaminans]PRG02849.1 MFS transporter [Burkholderia contaminans]
MRLTSWQQICLYVAADAVLNVASRTLQIYCTWHFVKLLFDQSALGSILLATSIASLVLLPFWGVMAERVKKSHILTIAALLSVLASIISILAAHIFKSANTNYHLLISLMLSGVVSSSATAALYPLGTSLLPEITDQEADIHKGMRLKSSMFFINLLLGPTLAGLAIGRVGGNAALILSAVSAIIGLLLSLAFLSAFSPQMLPKGDRSSRFSFFIELQSGVKRVFLIKAERAIAIASLFANILFVPFFSLILPTKLLRSGFSMFDLAIIELSLGIGVLLSSSLIISRLQKVSSEHTLACGSIALIGLTTFACGFSENFWALCVFNMMLGIGLTTFNVTVNSKRAISIPAGYRSTMESTMLFLCTAAVPLGLWLATLGLNRYSPDEVIIKGSETFIIAVVCIMFSRSLRLMLNDENRKIPYYVATNRELFEQGEHW